jgi:hypothetical protein
MKVMISISQILEMAMFALSFAPFTLCSYCTSAVSQVAVARTLGRRSVVGKGLLSMAHGHVLITHCDFGPNTKRSHPQIDEDIFFLAGNVIFRNNLFMLA